MSERDEGRPIETARVREVVGVVDDREALDALIDQLLLAGVDRGRISLMGCREAILDKLHHYYVEPTLLAEVGDLPRRSLVTRDDATALTALTFGTLVAIGSLAAGAAVLASGGAVAAALAAAGGGAGLAGIVARGLKRRVMGEADPNALEEDLAMGGLIVFVEPADDEQAAEVEAIVREHARNVHIHEIDVPKHVRDLPLGEIRPDPWLGDKRLGDA